MSVKSQISIFIALILSVSVGAQNITRSPYSNFGLGEILYSDFVHHTSAGFTSSTIRSNGDFSMINAASVSSLDYTGFQFGVKGDYARQYAGTAKNDVFSGSFGYFAMGFKVMNHSVKWSKDTAKSKIKSPFRWGMGIGVAPQTSLGYNFVVGNTDTVNNLKTKVVYSGTGGLTSIKWNNGFQIGNHISLGPQISYIFGQVGNESFAQVINDTVEHFGVSDKHLGFYSGTQAGMGMTYAFNINLKKKNQIDANGKTYVKKHTLENILAFTILGAAKLKVESSQIATRLRYSVGYEGWLVYDTILNTALTKSQATLPGGFTAGYSLKNNDKYRLAFEYRKEFWSKFKNSQSTGTLLDRTHYSVGISFNPDQKPRSTFNRKEKSPISFRLGYRYVQTPYSFKLQNGSDFRINENSIVLGLGIPIKSIAYSDNGSVKLVSTVNLSFEYVTRGNSGNGLVLERYFKVGVGANLSDLWFRKSKID